MRSNQEYVEWVIEWEIVSSNRNVLEAQHKYFACFILRTSLLKITVSSGLPAYTFSKHFSSDFLVIHFHLVLLPEYQMPGQQIPIKSLHPITISCSWRGQSLELSIRVWMLLNTVSLAESMIGLNELRSPNAVFHRKNISKGIPSGSTINLGYLEIRKTIAPRVFFSMAAF